jgi:hypothetical protein
MPGPTRSLRSILLDILDHVESHIDTDRGLKKLWEEGHAALIETAGPGVGPGRPREPHVLQIEEHAAAGKSTGEIIALMQLPRHVVDNAITRWKRRNRERAELEAKNKKPRTKRTR